MPMCFVNWDTGASHLMSLQSMQKLSLTVLLKFLSGYSHWNLVRQSDCYHLYFVAKELGEKIFGRRKKKCRKSKKLLLPHSKTKCARRPVKKTEIDTEDRAASVGGLLQQDPALAADASRRSSFSSFIWDDYLPSYKQESDGENQPASPGTLTGGSQDSGREGYSWDLQTDFEFTFVLPSY